MRLVGQVTTASNAVFLVEVDELKVHFPTGSGGETVKAVDGVSFAVRAGETFGVIGESGSGKSTLGRALVMLLKPTAGGLRLAGQDPHALGAAALRTMRRDYQVVFQDPNAALNPRMTIGDSVREPLDILGELPMARRRERVREVLERVGLGGDYALRYPHELSGGQKQRVNIARVLMLRPKMIVCDEVVAALDVSIQADMLNLFADLQRESNLGVLYITHDLATARHFSDEIMVLHHGVVVERGPSDDVILNPQHDYTRTLRNASPDPDMHFAGAQS
jgi:peptide/nickel transport system ATP-binding protein/oligopeptide transport system ATP-binding protein